MKKGRQLGKIAYRKKNQFYPILFIKKGIPWIKFGAVHQKSAIVYRDFVSFACFGTVRTLYRLGNVNLGQIGRSIISNKKNIIVVFCDA